MMDLKPFLTPDLLSLRAAFMAHRKDIRLVGGVVRDLLMGKEPKDVDLCTDATPQEMEAIAATARVAIHPTGITHGTMTFVLGDRSVYEITSLRIESEHDGRWASVAFTNDWEADLARRDLTINAMMLTFDGQLLDPHGGRRDLADRRVRFVGSADERMREDYLRILRWLRFQGRIAPDRPLDEETVAAARRQASGLARISKERIWAEVKKILAGEGGPALLGAIGDIGLAQHIGLQVGHLRRVAEIHELTRNAVTLLVANGGAEQLAATWRWSRDEIGLCNFLRKWDGNREYRERLAHDGYRRDWVFQLALLNGDIDGAGVVWEWDIPAFPITGADLMALGRSPGPEMGAELIDLKRQWADSDFTLCRDDLLASVPRP